MIRKVLLLALVIIVSVAIFLTVAILVDRTTSAERKEAVAIYEEIRDEVSSTLEQARQTLTELAGEPDIDSLDSDICAQPLARFLEMNSEIYDVFLRVRADGILACTPAGIPPSPVDFSDRVYYQKAVRAKTFVVGEFLVGKVSEKPVLAVALPVLDQAGNIEFLLVAGLKTGWLKKISANIQSDHNLLVEISDTSGVLLSQFVGTGNTDIRTTDRIELVRLPLIAEKPDINVIIYTGH